MTSTFASATTLKEALQAMQAGAQPVAGGTDLVVGARQGKSPLPESIVALHGVDELRFVDLDTQGFLGLGALVTHAEIADHPLIRERLTALADASSIVGSHATRAQGTLGGNIMNASPAMEIGGPLMVFDAAAVLLVGFHESDTDYVRSERQVLIADLVKGPGETGAAPDELLGWVIVPLPPEGTGSCYARLEYRRQMEIAVVGVTAAVTVSNAKVKRAQVAITALAPTVRLVQQAGKILAGSDGGAAAVQEAAQSVARAAEPISDLRASADYRRAMAEVVARRVITAAVARARGETVSVPASSALFGTGAAS